MRPKFGQAVIVRALAEKQRVPLDNIKRPSPFRTFRKRKILGTPIGGIYIGYRNISEGTTYIIREDF